MKKTIERKEFFGKLIYSQDCNTIMVDYDVPKTIQKQTCYLSAPTNVFMELTTFCNLRCMHCFKGEDDNVSLLPFEEWKNVLDQISKMGVFYVKLTGGEPFLYPHFFEIIQYLESIHLNYIIYTNGLFVPQNIEKLVNLKHLQVIRVSLEGTKEYNDNVRGAGVFDAAIESLKLLKRSGIKCSVNYTINRMNYHLVPLLENYLLNECDLKIPIHLGFIKHAGNSLNNNSLCFFNPMEYNMVIEYIENIIKKGTLIEPLYMLPEYFYKIYGNHFGCPAAQTSMVIKSNGDVIPCGLLPATKFSICGNIQNSSLISIWNNNKMNYFRNLIPPPECISCDQYLSNCTGACRANAFNLYNNINGNDINCDIYKSSLARQNKVRKQ